MLYSIDTGKYVTKIPHKAEFDKWMKNLSAVDYQVIAEELNNRIDESDINTAGCFQDTIGAEQYMNLFILLAEIMCLSQACSSG